MEYSRILIAPDKFKGSLTAPEVCEIIAEELLHACPRSTIIRCPLADGGEGSLDCYAASTGARIIKGAFTDPDFRKTTAAYALQGKTAFIETAQTAGLTKTDIKNPVYTTTYGVGEQIKAAAAAGAKHIVLAMGGSATNDAGCGMAAALGWKFLNGNGEEFIPVGGTLKDVARITPPEYSADINVTALCDVRNTLYGPDGAAYVYAAQKGASMREILLLDDGLRHINALFEQNGRDYSAFGGAGAAGGLGAGADYFLNAELRSGTETFFSLTAIGDKIAAADVVISGEGKIDQQSECGKVVAELYKKCRGKRFAAFCGTSELHDAPFEIYPVNRKGETLAESIANTAENLRAAVRAFAASLTRIYP